MLKTVENYENLGSRFVNIIGGNASDGSAAILSFFKYYPHFKLMRINKSWTNAINFLLEKEIYFLERNLNLTLRRDNKIRIISEYAIKYFNELLELFRESIDNFDENLDFLRGCFCVAKMLKYKSNILFCMLKEAPFLKNLDIIFNYQRKDAIAKIYGFAFSDFSPSDQLRNVFLYGKRDLGLFLQYYRDRSEIQELEIFPPFLETFQDRMIFMNFFQPGIKKLSFSDFPNLMHCNITISDNHFFETLTMFPHHQLKTLVFSFYETIEITSVIINEKFPNLEHLEIYLREKADFSIFSAMDILNNCHKLKKFLFSIKPLIYCNCCFDFLSDFFTEIQILIKSIYLFQFIEKDIWTLDKSGLYHQNICLEFSRIDS